ncbi:MAG TPA: 6-carboxytetrahydropterin synthase [Enhygromyxa sp.]|nr:6-carboxytetrahydropterin synthase [Enhygromyxa sp.]
MRVIITPKPVTFEAGHSLPQFCPTAHGHSYKVSVRVSGPLDEHGTVADFRAVRAIVKSVVAQLDHRMLNDIIENPTAERVALWLWDRVDVELRRAHPAAALLSLRLAEGEHEVEVVS